MQVQYKGNTESHRQINFAIKKRYEYEDEDTTCQVSALYSLLYEIPTS
jgi:hypothetical protein